MSKESFKFWVPLDLKKSTDAQGNEIMKIGGIASTSAKDTDGEFLDPNGFNVDYFKKNGYFNWHHQAKNDPTAIIGEPTKAEIRKEGLYVEGILYPDNAMAKGVWDQAKTLEKNSTTRRLGFSIEGKATKRKSDDKNHPDFKIVEKAEITGCAITFMPKNPKTFMDIIKGDTGEVEEEYDLETEEMIKSLSAGSITGRDSADIAVAGEGAALKSEDIDEEEKDLNVVKKTKKQNKQKFLTKAEVYEQILSKQPAINLLEAEKVFNYINKFAMKKDNIDKIEATDVEKALDLLDKAQDIVKGGDAKKEVAKKDEDEDEDDMPKYSKDSDEDSMTKASGYMDSCLKKGKKSKSEAMADLISKGGYPTDSIAKAFGKKEEGGDDEMEDYKKKKADLEKMEKALIEKGMLSKAVVAEELIKAEGEDFSKGFDDVKQLVKEKNFSVGVILKGIYDEIGIVKGIASSLKEENVELKKALGDSSDIIGGLESRLDGLSKALDEPVGRKSITSAPRERSFGGENPNDLRKSEENKNVISIQQRAKVLDVFDKATFEKGFDSEFSEAMTKFESRGVIDAHIAKRLANERGIVIQ